MIPFRGSTPQVGQGVLLAPTSALIGSVTLGNRVGIWFGSVLRGDIAPIQVGDETNIQDLSLLHVGDQFPCFVGRRCVVGHRAILHGCRVEDDVLVGMGATLLNGAVVGAGSIIAAGSLVTEGAVIPPGSLLMGTPGKIVRQVKPEQLAATRHLAEKYAKLAGEYLASFAEKS